MSLPDASVPENMVEDDKSEQSEMQRTENAPKVDVTRMETENDDEMNAEEMEEGEISDDEEESDSAKKGSTTKQKQSSTTSETTKSGNDIEAFLKKKREDLQQKVKSQLELAGYRAVKVNEGTEKDPDAILPDSLEKKDSSKKKSKSERKSHRYHDLDPEPQNAVDPQEAMINNWLSGRKKEEEESGYDPNDEFYFGARVSPVGDQNAESSADKDYRSSNRADKDYRWTQSNQRDFTTNTEDSDRHGTTASPDTSRAVASNEYGDRDYRHSDRGSRSTKFPRDKDRERDRVGTRRKRHSGESEEEEQGDEDERRSRDDRRKRRRSVSPIRRRSRWERPSICKFFREGYCRDGDDCTYSHNAADSMRKPELCKYYQQGYCKKTQSCPYLHGEYPCKAFHKGECSKGEGCHYSHTALNEFTQPIFDQMVKDEELAAKIKIPQVPTKRKVLLGAPPPMPPQNGPSNMNMMGPRPRFDAPPIGNQAHMNTNGPGPINNNGPMPPMPPFMEMQGGFPGMMPPPNFPPNFMPNVGPNLPPPQMQQQQSTNTNMNAPPQNNNTEQNDSTPEAGPTYDIGEMLRKIKATVQAEEEPEESPASPPPAAVVSHTSMPQNIPFHGVPKYRLILVDVPPATVNPGLLTKSLNDPKLRNDPRIKKLLDSQFNAVSNMITSQKSASGSSESAKSDPRVAAARDPRLAKQGTAASASDSPKFVDNQPLPPLSSAQTSESQIQEMIKMQLQMTAAMGHQIPPTQINIPPVSNDPSGMGMGGPMLTGPPAPSMFPNSGSMGGPMLGGPMLGSGPNSGGWMPQFPGPPSSVGMDSGYGGAPNTGIPPPGLIDGPVTLASMPSGGAEQRNISTKDPRNRSSRWNKSSPPSQSSPNYSENVPPNPDIMLGDISPPLDSKPVSLREKRKDLQYESPLAAGMARVPAGSDSSRYNEMPNVKVKRKTSPTSE